MSAILSVDDLNDFISPGVACIKPVETLPKQAPTDPSNPYEVQREDALSAAAADAPPAQISLTDCLACSGCVTSAEAVLVSLQSHEEVSSTLERCRSLGVEDLMRGSVDGGVDVEMDREGEEAKLFVASVSPQTRASLAATYGVTQKEAGNMIEQLLSGPNGLRSTSSKASGFTWVVDTNTVREICQAGVIEETLSDGQAGTRPKRPILASACPGWICYAEKTHPHVLPHISRLKSPQAMAGTLLKSVLSRRYGVAPNRIWHLAIMPCFDKKLEASREELTDFYWTPDAVEKRGVRDVDCVITARELIMLADTRGISFPSLPRTQVAHPAFPDPIIDRFLFPRRGRRDMLQTVTAGSSGGYAYQILLAQQRRLPGSEIRTERGRNVDVVEHTLIHDGAVVTKTARYYGFRNIQNLVRKLKPAKKSRMPAAAARRRPETGKGADASAMAEYGYIEVMACPGGCTNGGGQIKVSDVAEMRGLGGEGEGFGKTGPTEQKEWQRQVDEAYYSAESDSDAGSETHGEDADAMEMDGVPHCPPNASKDEGAEGGCGIEELLRHWASSTGVALDRLIFTTYRQVESDVGKEKGGSDMDRVTGLASTIGGGCSGKTPVGGSGWTRRYDDGELQGSSAVWTSWPKSKGRVAPAGRTGTTPQTRQSGDGGGRVRNAAIWRVSSGAGFQTSNLEPRSAES